MARLWGGPSVLVAFLLAAGVGGAYSGLLSPESGFRLFVGGVAFAGVSGLALAGASAFASATGRAWRLSAVRAAAFPLLVTLVTVLPRLGTQTPVIDDVTTDLEDPPAFPPGLATALEAPRPGWKELQQRAYPEVRPLAASEPPPQTFQRALKVAREMPGWEVTRADPARGVIEVVAASRIFRLRDDLVIRIRPDGEGSRLDLRSRSRIGGAYAGDPAARILSYQERFRAASRARNLPPPSSP